jgi:predicted glycosyltransferase
MIQIYWTSGAKAGLETAATLAASLRASGLPAGLYADAIPETITLAQSCDVARLISPNPLKAGDSLLVIGGQSVKDSDLVALRRLAPLQATACLVAGHFSSLQAEISIQSRFSYALGCGPTLLSLPEESLGLLASADAPVFGVEQPRHKTDGRLRVLVIAPDLTGTATPAALQALATARRLNVTVLTDGKSKELLRASGYSAPVYHYSEAPLRTHVRHAEVAIFCQPVAESHAMRMLLADLAVSGVGLLDASVGFANRKREPAFVPAPADPVSLAAFLINDIRPDLTDICQLSRTSALARQARKSLDDLRAALGYVETLTAAPKARLSRRTKADQERASVVFLPTNGVGLGHAQRCTLIAESLQQKHSARSVFAAFPSCMQLIMSRGFDVMPMVSKSTLHAEPLANDILNYVRLEPLLADAAAFVFDGGYVFNSIFHSVLERGLPSAWIRRGLWQAGQNNSVALEREKVFDSVIVPQEAFDELNEDYSNGPRITKVGPIVRQFEPSEEDRLGLRSALGDRFSVPFQRLVVTMLGGGVASDRSAQTAAICAGLARRKDVLHLVVTWPTATVEPGLFSWPNTRVVRTHNAGMLAAVADLYISAVGYNSFHEAMYNRIPTIFIPQVATFMDDQRARALAAVERDLACLVDPHQLMTLDRAIARMLDDGEAQAIRARLSEASLPLPGNIASAACIGELAGFPVHHLGRQPVQRFA